MNVTFKRLKSSELDFDIYPFGLTIMSNDYGSGIIFGLIFFVFYFGVGDNLDSISFSYEEENVEENTIEDENKDANEYAIDERGSD